MQIKKQRAWLFLTGLGLASAALLAAIARAWLTNRHSRKELDAHKSEGSPVYRLIRQCGIVLPARFAQINLWNALKEFVTNYRRRILDNVARFSILFGPFSHNVVRPQLLRMMGCKVGRKVFIGDDVLVDRVYPYMITIEDGAYISSRCALLAHQRDLADYGQGQWIGDCKFSVRAIHIGRGAHVGMGSIVLPGVTVGDGAIIGAGSVVVGDVPPYMVAVGVPARVMPISFLTPTGKEPS